MCPKGFLSFLSTRSRCSPSKQDISMCIGPHSPCQWPRDQWICIQCFSTSLMSSAAGMPLCLFYIIWTCDELLWKIYIVLHLLISLYVSLESGFSLMRFEYVLYMYYMYIIIMVDQKCCLLNFEGINVKLAWY